MLLKKPTVKPASSGKPASTAGRLKSVKPSGKKDESFFELVYEVARQIPRGRVTSYGAIANAIGAKSSARMVGWAMNGAGRIKPKVPAHRVVNRNGKIVDFQKLFWDPAEELGF